MVLFYIIIIEVELVWKEVKAEEKLGKKFERMDAWPLIETSAIGQASFHGLRSHIRIFLHFLAKMNL